MAHHLLAKARYEHTHWREKHPRQQHKDAMPFSLCFAHRHKSNRSVILNRFKSVFCFCLGVCMSMCMCVYAWVWVWVCVCLCCECA